MFLRLRLLDRATFLVESTTTTFNKHMIDLFLLR